MRKTFSRARVLKFHSRQLLKKSYPPKLAASITFRPLSSPHRERISAAELSLWKYFREINSEHIENAQTGTLPGDRVPSGTRRFSCARTAFHGANYILSWLFFFRTFISALPRGSCKTANTKSRRETSILREGYCEGCRKSYAFSFISLLYVRGI